ncbi:MAG TPA: sulfite exporter TauE/SafE family protein [Anaeromyxobacteraceae bacterium]|nr:sulfite exporter TauE/SafE family protein [Anaeromyxobacteraceae bacterium]
MTLETGVLLAAAAFVAGTVNAIAGGGTLVSFPALLAAGVPAVAANATNTVAVFPGQLASSFAYRSHLREERRRALVLSVPSLLGGVVGSVLLLALPERFFEAAVPWLILFACLLLALQGQLRRLASRGRFGNHPAALWVIQLAISIYGGYFGAGIGILMLAAMGVLLPSSIQHANALKVLFSTLINAIAAVIFVLAGAMRPVEAVLMAASAMLGGFLGARLAQRLPPAGMRAFAILVGLYAAGRMFLRG